MGVFKVGDYVWFIKTFQEINWRNGMFKPASITKPVRYKIIHIDNLKDGLIYQTKHGHFRENWIGSIVFHTENEAIDKLKNLFF